MALHAWATGDRITATRLRGSYDLWKGADGGSDSVAPTSNTTIDLSALLVTSAFKPPKSAGAAPTTEGVVAFDSTADVPVWGDGAATRKAVSLDQSQTLSNKTLDSSCVVTAGVNPSSSDFWILS